MTLLIMAAGIGSRFGGLKQIEPVGPSGEFIIDYSIYDAILNGFDKVIFIIKKENEELFKETIGKRIAKHVSVSYAFQDINEIPFPINYVRTKPWGTGQAILAASKIIDSPFAVINSDDFYGRDCFKKLSECLQKDADDFNIISYVIKNTLSTNGSVKRGVCSLKDNKLMAINESIITKDSKQIIAKNLITNEEQNLDEDALVSMNAITLTPKIFPILQEDFAEFISNANNDDEFLLPIILNDHLKTGEIKINLIKTSSKWIGMTYKEDQLMVENYINELIKKHIYPESLWNER